MKHFLNGTLEQRKHFFGGELAGPRGYKFWVPVLKVSFLQRINFRSLAVPFQAVFTVSRRKSLLYVTQVYVNIQGKGFPYDTYAWTILK